MMQTIRVRLEFVMEVPDDWRVLGTDRPEAGLLLVGDIRYEPGLMWMKVTETSSDTSESEQVDADTHVMLMDRVTACTESIDCDAEGQCRSND